MFADRVRRPRLPHRLGAGSSTGPSGHVCGIPLPAGPDESAAAPRADLHARPPRPRRATTRTSRSSEAVDLIGEGLAQRLQELTIALYERGAELAAERGIIVADTKFEFGFADGELILIDEVLTPDSSRFWPADEYAPGKARSRASTSSSCATGSTRAAGTTSRRRPTCPADVVERTARHVPRGVRARERRAVGALPPPDGRDDGPRRRARGRRPRAPAARASRERSRFEVLVRLKPGLLDPQGKAVEGALPTLGWTNVRDVRVGQARRADGRGRGRGRRPGAGRGDGRRGSSRTP